MEQTVAGGVGVIIDTSGHLGTVVSSERFKDAIKPMDKASEAILALKPVTFRYKHELDPEGIPQFGLVAEQVEKGEPRSRGSRRPGQALHGPLRSGERDAAQRIPQRAPQGRGGSKRGGTTKESKAHVAIQERRQSQIQKVSDQLEVSKAAPQMVANLGP